MSNGERFFEVLNQHEQIGGGIEPLEHWTIDDLLDLQEVIEAELAERDRAAQIEYFEQTQPPSDDDEDDTWFEDDIFGQCDGPDCGICGGGERE